MAFSPATCCTTGFSGSETQLLDGVDRIRVTDEFAKRQLA
jgi:hypothetical protein